MAFSEWQPGMRLTAGRLRASTPQAWQSWTPVWTTAGASIPSFGNSVIDAQYTEYGRVCTGRVIITFGSTATYGSGSDNWRFSTPVTASGSSFVCGWGELQDSSPNPSVRMGTRVRLTSPTTFECEVASGRTDGAVATGTGLVDDATPWTWASGDLIRFFFQYETAT